MSGFWDRAQRIFDLDGFAFWLKTAEPGAACRYYCGDLACERGKKGSATAQLAGVMLRAAEEGRVHLVQQRLLPPSDPPQFAYYAIKRGRTRR